MKFRNKSMPIVGSAAILMFTLTVSTQVMAHSSWLEVRDGKAVLIDGHPEDPSEERGYDAFRIAHTAAYDRALNPVRADVSHDGEARIDLRNKPALVTAHFNNGFWSQSPTQGWVRKPGSQVPDATTSLYSHKYSKLYLGRVDRPERSFGDPLEMVPLSDPTQLKPGDTLRLRVTLFGEPLADGQVAVDLHAGDDMQKLKTGADGTVSVTVPKRPLVLIEARHTLGLADDPHRVGGVFMSSTIGFHPKH
jgi:nickel transport protein